MSGGNWAGIAGSLPLILLELLQCSHSRDLKAAPGRILSVPRQSDRDTTHLPRIPHREVHAIMFLLNA